MKVVGIYLLAVVGLGIVVLGAVLAVLIFLSQATSYCPWSHELSDTASCAVLDETAGRALVQHANLDSNVYYLELVVAGVSRYYALPEAIGQLAPEGYSARIVSDQDELILLNGEEYRLSPLENAPSW